MTPTVEQCDLRERVEGDIRIAVWNTCCWQGKPQEVSQSFTKHLFEKEPCMIRAMSQVDAMRLRIERLEEALNAIIDRGPERDIKWIGMTARDIARAALCDGGGG